MFSATAEHPSPVTIPSGYHCAVTWGIPTDFGGMTSALLRRSRAFVREAGVAVDVLTFEYDNGLDDVRCEMQVAGELIPGMRLRNLWEEVAALPDEILSTAGWDKNLSGSFAPIAQENQHVEEFSPGALGRRTRFDTRSEKALQVDYFRPDGSLFVSDQRDVNEPGAEGGRLITLCDRKGEPVAAWNRMWPLYLFWLDNVVGSQETFMIVDSKSTANFITRFRRDNVVTLHLVHNSHMASGQVPPHGELSAVRRYVFERLHTYDGIVLLTERQKQDVDLAFGNPGNTFVVPNSTALPDKIPASNDRRQHDAVMLVSLTHRKRVDHAIKGIGLANGLSASPYNLRIFGQGPLHESLLALISKLGLEEHVHLGGFDSAPVARLAEASFVLLTSRMEGLPLVLLEAMSVGCIPIAYDMPYGPADIIVDGANGYLVEAGNVEGLADAILRLGSLSPDELQLMRQSARKTAERFDDRSVTVEWARVMSSAVDRKLIQLAGSVAS
ncbi:MULTISPECIES: glycosyltransferase [unclassified Arthrobacter]|uniref:glycosyltransferase n=1 Tax=unclassified Arthrobacter TaxID=235627 RepID=UPI002DFCFCDF|nr:MULTISPECIES: glycosyltransferase [unclassified Arthrobacter]MEC5193351.1 poly(glycerol-phosphate) alpha-glucosyltransferase [Arthrobacter sp. MP_M4]MEC5204817.1 poly(glycerol-phosphate) alpha-glucosyltransferase [Arthrobacter sp. MP_M7]